MKLFTLIAVAILSVNLAFAGTENASLPIFSKSFTASLKKEKSLFEKSTAKVCACQVLRVSSNNEGENYIAVFAQGTNNGDLSANFSDAMNVLEKEKKNLKTHFYSKVKTTENVTAATDCNSLYKNIQVKYQDVKMYDILDADALSQRFVVAQ